MPHVIAICGKGGVGKTALTALMTRALRGRPETGRLLVIDADPALGLLYALGVDTERTIGAVREKVLAAAESGSSAIRAEMADELDYLILNTLCEEKDFSFLAMGRMSSKGCFCSVNDLLRDAIAKLAGEFDTILIDGEAGLEQISRQVVDKVDTLVLAADASYRGIQTVHHIESLAKSGLVPSCKRIGVVFSRLPENEELRSKLFSAVALPVFGAIPFDEEVAQADSLGRPLLELSDDNPAAEAARKALDSILSSRS